MSAHSIISAFSEDDVEHLTGVTKRQLRYLDKDRFFVPSFAYEDRSRPYSRIYSFLDVVSLKVLNAIRNEARVPLSHQREVKEKLQHLGEDVWCKTTLYVLNKRVIFRNPETDHMQGIVSGQGVLQIPLKVITDDVQKRICSLRERDPDSIGRLDRGRGPAQNQLVISGTRIPVRSVKAFADAGYSVDQIRKEYPSLTDKDILAAIAA